MNAVRDPIVIIFCSLAEKKKKMKIHSVENSSYIWFVFFFSIWNQKRNEIIVVCLQKQYIKNEQAIWFSDVLG